MKKRIFSHFLTEANVRWKALETCRISRAIWPSFNKSKTSDLLSRNRTDIARIAAVCTGHWAIGKHAERLGIPFNPFCRSCLDSNEKESLEHFLCNCPALARARLKSLGKPFLNDFSELADIEIGPCSTTLIEQNGYKYFLQFPLKDI